MRTDRTARVLGPYAARDKWRLVIIESGGRKSLVFSSREQAAQARATIAGQLVQSSPSIGELIELLIADKRKRGLKQRSIHALASRLAEILPTDQPIASLSESDAQNIYDSLIERFATATHHAALKRAKELFRFAEARGHIRRSPFAAIEPVGRPRRGKLQLSIDEARKLSDRLRHDAAQGNELATALLLLLFLGLRTSEVLNRQVRDLDDGGHILVIPSGKTEQARRRLQCPDLLVGFLQDQARHKAPDALLFGAPTGHTQTWVWKGLRRYCRELDLPVVCPHSLRGLHSSLAIEAGRTSQDVAAQLGHKSFQVTAQHYIRPGTLENTNIRKISGLLAGDARTSDDDVPTARSALLAELARLPLADLAKVVAAVPKIIGQ